MEYAKERGETYFTEQLGIDFARECLGIHQDNIAKRLTQSQTQDLRVIRMIGDFQLHHCILRRYMKHKELLTDPGFIKIRDDFILHCARKGYAKSTISNYEHQASRFLDFLAAQKIHDAASITIDIVNAYIRTLIGHGIHDGNLFDRLGDFFTINRSSRADLRLAVLVVINGTQLNHGVVAGKLSRSRSSKAKRTFSSASRHSPPILSSACRGK